MKRFVVKLTLGAVLLSLGMSPAWAVPGSPQASPAPSAADQVFLATLALPATAPSPELAARRPGIVGKALCTATANCGSTTVTCSSNTSATSCSSVDQNCSASQQGGVTCNGVTTQCPACPFDCTVYAQQCADTCGSCQPVVQCNPPKCTCKRINGPCT